MHCDLEASHDERDAESPFPDSPTWWQPRTARGLAVQPAARYYIRKLKAEKPEGRTYIKQMAAQQPANSRVHVGPARQSVGGWVFLTEVLALCNEHTHWSST